MTREEAIRWLEEAIQDTDAYWNSCSEALQRELDEQKEVFLMALSALRPVSREQVEQIKGVWIFNDDWWEFRCSECHKGIGNIEKFKFCPHCGAPMTDEAVQMVMERMEALHENIYNG